MAVHTTSPGSSVRRCIIRVRANRLRSRNTCSDLIVENILSKKDDEYGPQKKPKTARKLT
jgi:hypothetical protein